MNRFGVVLLALALSVCVPAVADADADSPSVQTTSNTQVFVFIYRPGSAWRPGEPFSKQGLGPHGAYMKQLLDSGHIFLAGGFTDQDGGMAIVRAANIEEAQRLLKADPAITSGIFVGDVEGWAPRFRSAVPFEQR